MALAHIRIDPETGRIFEHGLVEHSAGVSELAACFAAAFGPDWARLAGLWHDLGKFRIGFQRYIRGVNGIDAHLEGKWPTGSKKTHSAAGALHALHVLHEHYGADGALLARALMYVIAGHHAGLANWTAGLDDRLLGSRAPDSRCEYEEAREACAIDAPEMLVLPANFDLRNACASIPGASSANPLAWSLWIRMLFSALVDADFLDTERFMDEGRSDRRFGLDPIESYRLRLDEHLDNLASQVASEGRADDAVM